MEVNLLVHVLRLLYFTQIFIYFSKPLRLLYSLIIYEIVNFSFFTLYSLLLLSFFLYLKSVPIYVIVHVHVYTWLGSKENCVMKRLMPPSIYMCTCMYNYVFTCTCIYLVDVFPVSIFDKVLCERFSVTETLQCRVHETRVTWWRDY